MLNSQIREALRAFILEHLLRTPDATLGDDDALLSSGRLDSMSLAEIATFIETRLGVTLPDTALTYERMDTLALIADVVEHYRQER